MAAVRLVSFLRMSSEAPLYPRGIVPLPCEGSGTGLEETFSLWETVNAVTDPFCIPVGCCFSV